MYYCIEAVSFVQNHPRTKYIDDVSDQMIVATGGFDMKLAREQIYFQLSREAGASEE